MSTTIAQDVATPTSPAVAPVKKAKRKTKLKPTLASTIRPGHQAASSTPERTLAISIPPGGLGGTVEEEARVQEIVAALREHASVGAIKGHGINNGIWQIVMRLASPASATDEEALNSAFHVLVPAFETFSLLKTGFGAKKPRWRFSGKDSVDSGYF